MGYCAVHRTPCRPGHADGGGRTHRRRSNLWNDKLPPRTKMVNKQSMVSAYQALVRLRGPSLKMALPKDSCSLRLPLPVNSLAETVLFGCNLQEGDPDLSGSSYIYKRRRRRKETAAGSGTPAPSQRQAQKRQMRDGGASSRVLFVTLVAPTTLLPGLRGREGNHAGRNLAPRGPHKAWPAILHVARFAVQCGDTYRGHPGALQ